MGDAIQEPKFSTTGFTGCVCVLDTTISQSFVSLSAVSYFSMHGIDSSVQEPELSFLIIDQPEIAVPIQMIGNRRYGCVEFLWKT
jgi:hypothetical protein